jgi:hypothetical protein
VVVRVESTDVSSTVVVVVVAIVEVTPASGPQATTPRREASRYAAAPQ